MATEIDLAVPATPGPGASVDISKQNSNMVLLYPGQDSDVIAIEQSFDGTNWVTVASLSGAGPSTFNIDAEANNLRANRKAGSGGAYTIQAAAFNAIGTPTLQTIAVGSQGTSAVIDISAQPSWVQLAWLSTPNNPIQVQHSLDNVNWYNLVGMDGGQLLPIQIGTTKLRVVRPFGSPDGTTGTLQVQGLFGKGS